MPTTCPYCGTVVEPAVDQTCPACRRSLLDPPTFADPSTKDLDRAWENYQQSLVEPPWLSELNAFHQIEDAWVQNRPQILRDLEQRSQSTQSWADGLERELLPEGQALYERFSPSQDPQTEKAQRREVLEYLAARIGSWQVLRDALRQQNPELIPRHQELWDASQMMMLSALQGHLIAPGERKHPQEAAAEFQAALVSFTPRLLVLPALIVINVAIYILMVIKGVNPLSPSVADVLAWGGNFGPKTLNGEWWRLVTCMFLHFGIIHLAFNMWVLWDIGQLVERLVGHVGFFLLFMLSGLLGSLASLLRNPERVVSAGASGAVFGVCGALLGFILLRRDTVPKETLAHLKGSMTAFLGYNLIFGLMIPNIDMAAHVGGLIGGLICGAVLSQPLSREMIRRRPLRNVLAAVAGSAVCGLVFLLLPQDVMDIEAEMLKLGKIEDSTMRAYNEIVTLAENNQITDEEIADRVETEVLPPWRDLRAKVQAIKQSKGANPEVIDKMDRYLEAREEAWVALVQSARENKPELLDDFQEKWEAANKMLTAPN